MSSSAGIRPLLAQPASSSTDDAAQEAWSRVLSQLQEALPEKAFHTWFQPLQAVVFENRTLTVEVPSRFYYDWIEGHYASHIESALEQTFGPGARLVYVVAEVGEENGGAQPLQVRQAVEPPRQPRPESAPTAPASPGGVQSHPRASHNLNPRYVFETFIEGPQNQFARAAAQAVAQAPGSTAYNPLLIYGGVGLGKTHLLQAIGNEVARRDPSKRILYIDIERFTQDFVESIKGNRADAFSARYRAVDVLLIDDVHFLVGRERTQMEFFHTFNALHQAGKQIVLTSDKPPRELDGLDERLVSRFGWGLVCDIAPPDFDTRMAIIEKHCDEEGVSLDPEVTDYLARSFTKNVREMQGALIRLVAHASLNGQDLTIELARRALRDLVQNQERRVSIDTVQRVVARHYQVAPDLLMAKIRTQPIAQARMVAMSLAVRLTRHSLKQVGAHFGKRDHTTVLHARKKVEQWEREDEEFAGVLQRLIQTIEQEQE